MPSRSRVLVAIVVASVTGLVAAETASAQTGGLEAPSLWLLVASLAQIVGAAAVIVFFITRKRPRRCPRCGRRLDPTPARCPRCGRELDVGSRPGPKRA